VQDFYSKTSDEGQSEVQQFGMCIIFWNILSVLMSDLYVKLLGPTP